MKKLSFHHYTPDIALRRYEQAHSVFLWDALTNDDELYHVCKTRPIMYRAKAVTVDRYIPVYNLAAATSLNEDIFSAYMVRDSDEMEFFEDESLEQADHLPVFGKVIRCSTAELINLDEYYRNTTEFKRALTQVKSHPSSQELLTVWSYFSPVDTLGEFDYSSYTFVPWEEVEMVPFSTTNVAGMRGYGY